MEDLLSFLRTFHGHFRWLVLLVVVLAAAYMLYGAVRQQSYDKLAYRIMLGFSSVIGVQWALGLVFFLTYFAQGTAIPGFRWEHALTNTIALAVAHGHFSMKKHVEDESPQPKLYWRALLIVGLTMLFVFIAVTRLPYYSGWGPMAEAAG